jgi:FMN-dependent NADH-azoreductase
MKKIIALSCSPSVGRNSDTMLDSFLDGVSSVKGIEFKKIYLKEIPIEMYEYSNSKGAGENEKEFKELTDLIQDSEGLVISTPTYNFSVPGHLKNFIDRMGFISLDYKNQNKLGQPIGRLGYLQTYFLVSGGTPKWAEILFFFAFPSFWLRAVFLYFGSEVMGAYYSGDIKTFENKRILNKCHRLGVKYAYMVLEERKRGFLERLFFRPPQNM